MTAESGQRSHVRVYLDEESTPLVDTDLPMDMALDTLDLTDGAHRLIIRAQGSNGREGLNEIPFIVRNGPGIVVSGLRPHSTRSGTIRLTVDAFSTDDPFDPRRAEARSEIPVWVWVMSLFVVAWAVWYAARMWEVPAAFSHSPTYSGEGSYRGGKLLFLGLGTGLGTTMIVDGIVEPMELAHLPYKKTTYEDYIGLRGLKKHGREKWRKHVIEVVSKLVTALEPDDIVLGGGNVKLLEKLPKEVPRR